MVGRDSVVGISTRYGLEGPELKLRWRCDSPNSPRPVPRPTQPPEQLVTHLFPGGKAAGKWRLSPTPTLEPRLKKERSYTFTQPVRLHGRL